MLLDKLQYYTNKKQQRNTGEDIAKTELSGDKRETNGAKRSQTEPNRAHRDRPGSVETPSMGGDRQKKFGKTPDMGPQDPLSRSFVCRLVRHGRSAEATESSARRPGWLRCRLETSAPSEGGEGATCAAAGALATLGRGRSFQTTTEPAGSSRGTLRGFCGPAVTD